MQPVALVTDSTAGLSSSTCLELGIEAVPASFAFAEERFLDGAVPWRSVYERMRATSAAPRTFGAAEAAFRSAFESALERAEAVFCLLAPFDVNPSFTTACAAMLGIQFDAPDAKIKVANAGVGSAGLGALLLSLAPLAASGATVDDLVAAVEDLEPRADSLFVVEDVKWLEAAGRLALVEERLGSLEGKSPVLRLGTRLTGISAKEEPAAALEDAVHRVAARAGGGALNAVILHAGDPERAARAANLLSGQFEIQRLELGELPVTHGSQLGPGAVGIGVCPVARQGAG